MSGGLMWGRVLLGRPPSAVQRKPALSAVEGEKPGGRRHSLSGEFLTCGTVNRRTPHVTSDPHHPPLLSKSGRFSRRIACAFRQFASLLGFPVSSSRPPDGAPPRTRPPTSQRKPKRPSPCRQPLPREQNCIPSAPPFPPPPSSRSRSPPPARKSMRQSAAKPFPPSPAVISAARRT